MPGLAQAPVAARDREDDRRARARDRGTGAGTGPALRGGKRVLLHRQLRTSLPGPRSGPGPRRGARDPRRSPAHQELGHEDRARDQAAQESAPPRAHRHAAGEPLGRAPVDHGVPRPARLGRAVEAHADLCPRRRRGSGHRLREPRPPARAARPAAHPPHARRGADPAPGANRQRVLDPHHPRAGGRPQRPAPARQQAHEQVQEVQAADPRGPPALVHAPDDDADRLQRLRAVRVEAPRTRCPERAAPDARAQGEDPLAETRGVPPRHGRSARRAGTQGRRVQLLGADDPACRPLYPRPLGREKRRVRGILRVGVPEEARRAHPPLHRGPGMPRLLLDRLGLGGAQSPGCLKYRRQSRDPVEPGRARAARRARAPDGPEALRGRAAFRVSRQHRVAHLRVGRPEEGAVFRALRQEARLGALQPRPGVLVYG